MYPAAIVIVMLGSVMVLMTLVVPKLVELFGEASKLPPLTRALMSVSNFFVNYWWLLVG